MDTCQTCTTRGADQCAAIWNFDPQVIACLRHSAEQAQRAGILQISIAQFLIGLCRDDTAQHMLRRFGTDVHALEHDLTQLVRRDQRAAVNGRVVLSHTLNALLVAAEETARYARRSVITLDVVLATLMENANQDPAAGVFYRHATAAGDHCEIKRRALQASERRDVREVEQQRTYPVAASQHSVGASNLRSQLPTVADHQSGSAHTQPVHRVGAEPTRMPYAAPLRRTGTYNRAAEFRSGDGLSGRHEDHSATRTTSGFENAQRHLTGSASRETTEREHYETILQMLRVQEARLERLESDSTRKRNGLKLRKIALGSLSGRSGKASKSRSRTSTTSASSASSRSERDRDRGRDRHHDYDREQSNRDRAWVRGDSDNRNQGNRRGEGWSWDRQAAWYQRDLDRDRAPRATREDRQTWSSSHRSNSKTRLREERPDRNASQQIQIERSESKKEKRFYLSREDDLVEAPSIGPKTAARFTPLGIHTVRDLLELDADAVAEKLNVRHITADVLRDWQDQARLVCTVPWLRGTHAQLLVGADYRSAEELVKADLGEVLAGILRFAGTNQGERILRTNPPPERDKVATWLGYAKQAEVDRVA